MFLLRRSSLGVQSTLLALGFCAFVNARSARAADDDDQTTEATKSFKFTYKKKPELTDEEKKAQEESKLNQTPITFKQLRTTVNYPRYKVDLSYLPTYLGLKQTLQSPNVPLSIGTFLLVGFGANATVEFSPRFSLGLELQVLQLSVGDAVVLPVVIQSSSVTTIPIHLVAGYTFFLGNFSNKLTPGIDVGIESLPVLSFLPVTSTIKNASVTLNAAKVNDMAVGGRLTYEMPLLPSLNLKVASGYELGLKTGATTGVSVSKDYKIWGLAQFDTPISGNWSALFGFGVEDRVVNFTSGTIASSPASWNTTNLNYAAMLGVRYSQF